MDKRQFRIDVFNETIEHVLNSKLIDESKIIGTWVHSGLPSQKPRRRFDVTEVSVINRDCLLAAIDEVNDGNKVCVLNMASFKRPGGGVLNGSMAQEEELFRRTNLFRSLYMYDKEKFNIAYGDLTKDKKGYPLGLLTAIYSPGITILRDTPNTDYAFLPEDSRVMVDVVTSSAVRNYNEDATIPMIEKVRNIMTNKIHQMLAICAVNDVDVPVLGAYGCGAYRNNPEEVAQLFKNVILEYDGVFKKIVFPVLDDGNSHKEHNPNGNFEPFERILTSK